MPSRAFFVSDNFAKGQWCEIRHPTSQCPRGHSLFLTVRIYLPQWLKQYVSMPSRAFFVSDPVPALGGRRRVGSQCPRGHSLFLTNGYGKGRAWVVRLN